jgi:hypothetical protein
MCNVTCDSNVMSFNLSKGDSMGNVWHDAMHSEGIVSTYLNGKLFKTTDLRNNKDSNLIHTYEHGYNHTPTCQHIAEVVDCGICGSIVLSWTLCN